MSTDPERRRALLTAALGFALVGTKGTPAPPEVQTVRKWLDNWRGLGDVVTGMNRQGYRLHLTNVDEATWRATFSSAPQLAADGFGADPTPWRAVPVAAWEALTKPEETAGAGGGHHPAVSPTRSIAPLLALIAIAACTGAPSGLTAARAMHPCLPPAMSARFFFWPVVGLHRVNVLTEDGELAEGSWVLYRRGHAGVAALRVHSDLVAVDPELETDAPEWIDLSLVTVVKGELVLQRHPEAPCRWARWIHSEVMNRDTPRCRRSKTCRGTTPWRWPCGTDIWRPNISVAPSPAST